MNDTRAALRRLEAIYAKRSRLFLLHLDLTWRCPQSCPHCYLGGAPDPQELDAASWFRLMDEARALGVVRLVFSGGEPMLRPDFISLVHAARERGFALLVKTTGVLIRDSDADAFARLAWISLDISLHSTIPAVHDRFVGMPGAWNLTVAAIDMLKTRGVTVRITRSAVDGTGDDGGAMREWCKDRDLRLGEATTVIRERDGRIPETGLLAEDARIAAIARSITRPDAESMPPPQSDARLCAAGRTRLYITPGGDVTPCVAWHKKLGNIQEGGLTAALSSPDLARVAHLRQSDRIGCAKCEFLPTCDFCPGQADLIHGDPIAPYDEACTQAGILRKAIRQAGSRR